MKNGSGEQDSGVLSNPLSFLRSGHFDWGNAGLYYRSSLGYYWSLYSTNDAGSNGLYFNNANLDLQNAYRRGYGFAVHYAARSRFYMSKRLAITYLLR